MTIDSGFEFRSGQTKDYKIGFCYQHYKNPTKRFGLVQSGPHHLIEN